MPSPSCNAPPPERHETWAKRPGATARVWPSEQMIRLLCRSLPQAQRGAMTAVDVGCGNGRNAIALPALGFGRVIAIDPSQALVDVCRQAAVDAGCVIDARCGALPSLPCEGDPADVVIAWRGGDVLDDQAGRTTLAVVHLVALGRDRVGCIAQQRRHPHRGGGFKAAVVLAGTQGVEEPGAQPAERAVQLGERGVGIGIALFFNILFFHVPIFDNIFRHLFSSDLFPRRDYQRNIAGYILGLAICLFCRLGSRLGRISNRIATGCITSNGINSLRLLICLLSS